MINRRFMIVPPALPSGGHAEPHDSPHFPSAQLLRRFATIPYQIGGFPG
jgi:hypothetical protein